MTQFIDALMSHRASMSLKPGVKAGRHSSESERTGRQKMRMHAE